MGIMDGSGSTPRNTAGKVIGIMSLYNTTIKDTFAANLAYMIAKKTNEKVLLIDFECPFPALDHYFNTDKYIYLNDLYNAKRLTGVSGCLNGIRKGILTAQTFSEYVKEIYNLKNLSILTGLYEIDLFEDFEAKDVETIINVARSNFDTVIIAMNSFIFNVFTYVSIMQSNRVLLVSESTITNGRANINMIKQFETVQKVSDTKFSVVLWGNLMDPEIQKRLYEGYEILDKVPDDPRYLGALLHKKLLLSMPNAQNDVNAYTDILVKLGYLVKQSKFKMLMHAMRPRDDDTE